MKKKIKVLHVIASLGNGGAERQLIELLKYNRNHSVLLLTDSDMYKDTLNELGIKYWEMKVKNKLFVFSKIFIFPVHSTTISKLFFFISSIDLKILILNFFFK